MNKYREELDKILSIIEEKHIDMYFNINKEELNKYVEELLSQYKLEDSYDLYYIANVIIKKLFGRFDSHTKIVWRNADFNLPVRLKYIDGKVYIIKATEDNKDLLYGEILSINNVPIKQLLKEIEEMIAYSTNGFLYMQMENILYNGIKLRSLPSIESNSDMFEFQVLKDDKIIKRNLTKSDTRLYQDDNYTYNIIDGVLHIIYSSCREKYEGQMIEFIQKIEEESKKNNITKFIVDIRDNSGGNSEIIKPLIEFLNDKEVITLTDKYVFSGGRFALYDLKNIGSITIGAGIGTTLNCFGNNCVEYTDDFIIPISFKYFYYDEKQKKLINIRTKEDFFAFKNNPNNKVYFEPQSFEPDYNVENQIDDYEDGYDRQLHSAILLFQTRRKNDRNEQFLKIKTPEELMEFLDNNISYGWVGKDEKKYINTLSHVRENYRTSTIEEIFETGLVTCAEDAKLIKYFLDRLGYETKLYCHRAYETEENFDQTVKMHCFVLFKKDGHWYHFEHSMTPIKDIYEYDTIEEALNWITSKWKKGERQLAEIDDIPDHLTFKELNEYVNTFGNEFLNQKGKSL